MFAQLEVIAGADRGRIFPLTSDAPLVIGRGRQTVTRLSDPRISRVHCQLEIRGDDVIVKDLNSAGGTLVNGSPVGEQVLRLGDVIRLGETILRFTSADMADQNTLPPPQADDDLPMALPIDAPPRGLPSSHVTPGPLLELPASRGIRAATPMPTPEPPFVLPAALDILEALPAAIPISDSLPAAIPLSDERAAAAPPRLLPGERLGELTGGVLGHYQLGDVIARGRSGIVFRASDFKHHREAALKVLRPEFTRDDSEVQRFIRSMKTMLPLRHPNLVTLFGAGKKGPYCWIAMEFVEGESLAQVIQRIGVAGMLDWRHAFRVAVHIARALDFAHGRHIVHRNLTPRNVLIRDVDHAAKLGDLMLAKATEGSMAQHITQANEVLGDLRYMSPEQTFGPDQMDGRSDIYSLGTLLYATLTGQPPFEAGNLVETITRIRQAPVVMPKTFQMSIPDTFQTVILRMLAKRPEDRYQTADHLLRELERFAKYQGLSS